MIRKTDKKHTLKMVLYDEIRVCVYMPHDCKSNPGTLIRTGVRTAVKELAKQYPEYYLRVE